MAVHNVELELELNEDRLVDVFVMQWHTPVPSLAAPKIAPGISVERDQVLRAFGEWLHNYFEAQCPERPLVVIAPELSVPLAQMESINALIDSLHRPTIAICGIEYLHWDEYVDILGHPQDMPRAGAWTDGGLNGQLVNAAMVSVRDCHGNPKRYIQPKRHPCDAEQAFLYSGRDVLRFSSSNQTPGARLNFCVQICSDFSSDAFVRELRRECVLPVTSPLDLTVLLQLNSDQEAAQFKNSVRAYFAPPEEMVETDRGCLLFVNTASPAHGRSQAWGRSKLHFSFPQKFRTMRPPPPTFWLQDDGPHDYQAIVLRESGPGLYWLKYKPRYLVNVMPGAGQVGPFPDEHAMFARIENAQLQVGPPGELFKHLHATLHWLQCEWTEGESVLGLTLRDNYCTPNEPEPEFIHYCLQNYATAKADWMARIAPGDNGALQLVDLLFSSVQDRPEYPPEQPEPQLWCDEACKGARSMIWAYALFKIATEPRGLMRPHPAPTHHALLAEATAVTLLWGADSVCVERMISTYLARLQQFGAGDSLYNEHALILINPLGTPAREQLRDTVKRLSEQVQEGEPPNVAGPHLKQGGEAVSMRAPAELRCVYASDLYGAIHEVAPDELSRTLQQIVTGAIYAE